MLRRLFDFAQHIENDRLTAVEATSRRVWLKQAGLATAGGAVLIACGTEDKKKDSSSGSESMGTESEDLVADGKLLNAALALEHEAIALYTAAAGLEYMKAAEVAPILAIAGTFLSHHTTHRDALMAAIGEMRQKNSDVEAAVATLESDSYVKPYLDILSDETNGVRNVLRLAAERESNAAKAYLGLIAQFKDPALAQTSGMLGGDEAAHYGALRAALFAVIQDQDVTPETVIPAALPTGFVQKLR